MRLTPEEEVGILREAIHNALTCLEKDKGIYDKSKEKLIEAYTILEKAFMKTGHSVSYLMGIDRERRGQKIKSSVEQAKDLDLYEVSEHLSDSGIWLEDDDATMDD